jgi:hypothetical protein
MYLLLGVGLAAMFFWQKHQPTRPLLSFSATLSALKPPVAHPEKQVI